MKIHELPILARIDPKTKKTHVAAKKCCGTGKPAICCLLQLFNHIKLLHLLLGLDIHLQQLNHQLTRFQFTSLKPFHNKSSVHKFIPLLPNFLTPMTTRQLVKLLLAEFYSNQVLSSIYITKRLEKYNKFFLFHLHFRLDEFLFLIELLSQLI